MKTAWNKDHKSLARQDGVQVCWYQHLSWVLKETLQKDLPIISP